MSNHEKGFPLERIKEMALPMAQKWDDIPDGITDQVMTGMFSHFIGRIRKSDEGNKVIETACNFHFAAIRQAFQASKLPPESYLCCLAGEISILLEALGNKYDKGYEFIVFQLVNFIVQDCAREVTAEKLKESMQEGGPEKKATEEDVFTAEQIAEDALARAMRNSAA